MNLSEYRCAACGDVIDYCQGHGMIGDPLGYAILQGHDLDYHGACHPAGCPFTSERPIGGTP